jgi:hypothetical protein
MPTAHANLRITREATSGPAAPAPDYTVRAHRWARGWELHIDGIGVTQCKALRQAEAMARDYIALDKGVAPDSFSIEILPQVEGTLDQETAAAREAVADADKAQRAAAAESRTVVRKLRNAGLTGRDIAVVLRISPQRVSQLLRDGTHGALTRDPR